MEKWLDPKTITTWITIVLAVTTMLVVSFVKLLKINLKRAIDTQRKESQLKIEHQNNLVESNIIAQEQERTRIAADLHDSLIGKLTIVRLKNQSDYNYQEIDVLLGEVIQEARRISHDLSPPMLEFLELDELLEDIIAPWHNYLTIYVHIDINPSTTINAHIKIQIARIVQELLTNTYNHANASSVYIQLKTTERYLTLIVRDNGSGFDTRLPKKGIGLNNIELRVTYLKGAYKIKSSPKGSTAIIILNHQKFSEL